MVDFAKYAKMGDINIHDSYTPKEKVDPSDEFFKSIYISGSGQKEDEFTKTRLHVGMLQIRGIKNNLEEIYILPYYRRQILNNQVKMGKYDNSKCFSYADHDEEGRQTSTSGFFCPQTSAERKEIKWCYNCKTAFIIAGFLVTEDGQYILNEDDKPTNVFIRATGSKVGDIMSYVFDCQDLEVPFLFDDSSKESENMERKYFNMFRRIIKVTAGDADVWQSENTPDNAAKKRSAYVLEGGIDIDKEKIIKLLDYAGNIDDKLKEKFDFTEGTIERVKKNYKRQLAEFQNSAIFKENNPTFVSTSSDNNIPDAPGFMTVDEPATQSAVDNVDTSNIPDSNTSSIDDIPF